MLDVSSAPLITPRLELRRTRMEDAAAMFEALRAPEMYAFIPRAAPESVAEVEQRFARLIEETAPGRAEQWLSWTVWLREGGAPIGMTEATAPSVQVVSIGYMFDPRHWRRGYGREAVTAMLDHLAAQGARQFEASIDVRNAASKALITSLGFKHTKTEGIDELWRREDR
jgi:[ribosomal protein S5]-alanine N-acetyltransferase